MNTTWTEERKAEVRSLWGAGHSASMIARALGQTTRNAVLGLIHRNGWCSRDGRERKPKARVRRSPRPRVPVNRLSVIAPPEPIDLPSWPFSDDVAPKHIGLADLTSDTCRWPYGDRAPYTFCGHEPAAGSPYCAAHRRLGTEKPRRPLSLNEATFTAPVSAQKLDAVAEFTAGDAA